MSVEVAVIGGGVSGLATAFALARRGHRVVVLERQVRPGGNAISERFDGFLMEKGPSTINAASDAANSLSTTLGLDRARCELGHGVRRRYLVGDRGLAGISTHPLGFFFSDYLSLGARLRMAAEIAIPRRGDGESGEENVAEFCSRRFGRGFSQGVMDALAGGLYSGRATELSLKAVFPKLLEMEQRYGSVTLGVLARKRSAKMPSRRLFSWNDGIGALPRALAGALGDAVRTGVTVRRIGRRLNGFTIDLGEAGVLNAKAVVLATQPHVAAALLEGVDANAAQASAGIQAPPMAVVFLGYRRRQVEHPLDGLGYLAAEDKARNLNGAQFCSTMFPGRAPDGFVSLAGYVGGTRTPENARLPERDLVNLVAEEFGDLLGAKGEPVVARVQHWAQGLPQYQVGHRGRVAQIRAASDRQPGLFVTGNYFSGPSVAACIALGAETAAGVDRFLARSRPCGLDDAGLGRADIGMHAHG